MSVEAHVFINIYIFSAGPDATFDAAESFGSLPAELSGTLGL